MHKRFLVGTIFLIMSLAACQGSPPTVVYVVVSPTPADRDASVEPTTLAAQVPTSTLIPTAVPPTTTPSASSTPNLLPTETNAQVQVAEQVFENGRMFWVQPVLEIWVMVLDVEGKGTWMRYKDTFEEGVDPETDASLIAPEGKIQPERGFGKLWRENPDVREALGWAITPEFGYISEYEYHPGGTMQNGRYISGPGFHELLSLNSEAFCFMEETGTWSLGC